MPVDAAIEGATSTRPIARRETRQRRRACGRRGSARGRGRNPPASVPQREPIGGGAGGGTPRCSRRSSPTPDAALVRRSAGKPPAQRRRMPCDERLGDAPTPPPAALTTPADVAATRARRFLSTRRVAARAAANKGPSSPRSEAGRARGAPGARGSGTAPPRNAPALRREASRRTRAARAPPESLATRAQHCRAAPTREDGERRAAGSAAERARGLRPEDVSRAGAAARRRSRASRRGRRRTASSRAHRAQRQARPALLRPTALRTERGGAQGSASAHARSEAGARWTATSIAYDENAEVADAGAKTALEETAARWAEGSELRKRAATSALATRGATPRAMAPAPPPRRVGRGEVAQGHHALEATLWRARHLAVVGIARARSRTPQFPSRRASARCGAPPARRYDAAWWTFSRAGARWRGCRPRSPRSSPSEYAWPRSSRRLPRPPRGASATLERMDGKRGCRNSGLACRGRTAAPRRRATRRRRPHLDGTFEPGTNSSKGSVSTHHAASLDVLARALEDRGPLKKVVEKHQTCMAPAPCVASGPSPNVAASPRGGRVRRSRVIR